MAFRPTVVQTGPFTHVLPRLAGMNTEVTAHLSPALFAHTDETLWSQAATAASMPGVTALHLMPDTHVGYLLPVGGVIATDGVVVLAASGYDIGCGMISARLEGVVAGDLADPERRLAWVRAVERRVALGLGSHRPDDMLTFSETEVERVFREGARVLGIPADLCERKPLPVRDDFSSTLVEKARRNACAQLGSLGGGNHFIELQADPPTGEVYVMVHTGSRAYGWQTAEYFFFKAAEHRGLRSQRREESWLGLDEDLGQQYLSYHNSAANYASANRWAILKGVEGAVQEVFRAEVKPVYEISHNLTQPERVRQPDGSYKTQWIGRKGATRALPAGHVDLVGTRWAHTGHPCLVPGSMFEGAAILRPREGAWGSLASVNHGSGRLLGRAEAKRELRDVHDLIDEEMREVRRTFGGAEVVGIVGNSERTPLDECGQVYKALDQVLEVLVQDGIAEVERRLWPIAWIKGTD